MKKLESFMCVIFEDAFCVWDINIKQCDSYWCNYYSGKVAGFIMAFRVLDYDVSVYESKWKKNLQLMD